MLKRSLFLAAILAFANGCIISSSGGTTAQTYARCESADFCAGSSVCLNASVASGTTGGGQFCSDTCVVSADCPASADGRAVTCVTAGGTNQCYRSCAGAGDCPAGFGCVDGGGSFFCAPGTEAVVPTGTPVYDRCAGTGAACLGGATCAQASVTTTGAAGFYCTGGCSTSDQCPASPQGAPVSCVVTDGLGQCYELCDANNLCTAGFSCATVSGINICTPDQ